MKGIILLVSLMGVNAINLAFNAYMGRVLTFETFGLLSLINTFLFLAFIPFNALSTTINHSIAFSSAKKKTQSNVNLLSMTKKKILPFALFASFLWMILSPFISHIFHINDIFVPLIFAPVLTFGLIVSINKGFLQGNFNFYSMSILLIFEALSKFFISWIFVSLHLYNWVYLSITLSIFATYVLSNLLTKKQYKKLRTVSKSTFPKDFFFAALISGIASMAFFTFDLLLAKHFLSPNEAGQYALLSLIGKIVYFLGILPSYLMVTYVSKDEGSKRNPIHTFYKLFMFGLILTFIAFVTVTFLGKYLFPFIFGDKVFEVLPYVSLYATGIAFLTLSATITSFHIAKKQYFFPVVSIIIALFMSIGIIIHHNTIQEITQIIFFSSVLSLGTTTLLHIFETNKLLHLNERWIISKNEK